MAAQLDYPSRLSVAPMMDWTDRHCRVFHRLFSARAELYTEMVTASALVRGQALWLLEHDAQEHPLVLQLGGSDPEMLAEAVRLAKPFGFSAFNLNVGCPSDRVQSGCFGAVLMERPALVADCMTAMAEAAGDVPVTVKCRIGVDDQDPETVLPEFLGHVAGAGVRHVVIHARKAWLQGLSPKQNRDVPPLDYPLVHRMKAEFPNLSLAINGGLQSLEDGQEHLAKGMDGVMYGRAAYQAPAQILGPADGRIFGQNTPPVAGETAVRAMLPYIDDRLVAGDRLHQITRHLLGAFAGRPGARRYRQILSDGVSKPGAGPEVVLDALRAVEQAAA